MKKNSIKINPKYINEKQKPTKQEKTIYTKFVEILPVGYPFDFSLMEEHLEINDIKLLTRCIISEWKIWL